MEVSGTELYNFTTKALKKISPIYEQSNFIKNFFNAIGSDFDLISSRFKTFSGQSFIDTVDWAIACQELKYSLEIREDLSLEERRKRLGIKARTHRPLNPAILERYIKDSFDLEVYLHEKDAGYIKIFADYFTEKDYRKMIEWLSVEKPAHLSLSTHLNLTEYVGGGSLAPRKIYHPAAQIPLPETIEDKKNYPRLFVGIGEIITGVERVDLNPLKDSQAEIHAGIGLGLSGEVTHAPKQLKHSQIVMKVGVTNIIVGKVWIDSIDKPTLPYYPFRLEPPYELDDNHDFYYDMIDKAKIYLDEPRRFLKAPKVNAVESFGFDDFAIPDDLLPKQYEWRNIVENPYADLAYGGLTIPRGKYQFEDIIIEPEEWDVVKIFFGFPISRHRRCRGIAMPSPRPDLTREEVKEVGQYAVDNQLIMNERGEYADKVLGGAFKRREVTEINLEELT